MNTLSRILLMGGLILSLSVPYRLKAPGFQESDVTEQTESTSCSICYEEYTRDSIVIQLDCDQSVAHHYCLDCISKWAATNNGCPLCRKAIKFYNPCIQRGDFSRIHHRYTPLTRPQQLELKTLLASKPVSHKPMPQTINRYCTVCKDDVAHENIMISFTCSHGACLTHAVDLNRCPTCRGSITIVDPLMKDAHQQPIVAYKDSAPEFSEVDALTRLRSAQHINIYQDHIDPAQRLPIFKSQEPRREGKDDPAPESTRPTSMPIVPGFLPDMPITSDDVQLNEQLPTTLDPKIWQVIVDMDGTLKRIKRAHPLTEWPPTSYSYADDTPTEHPSSEGSFEKFTLEPVNFVTGTISGIMLGHGLQSDPINFTGLIGSLILASSIFWPRENNKEPFTKNKLASLGFGMITGLGLKYLSAQRHQNPQ